MKIDINKMQEIISISKKVISSRNKIDKLDAVYLNRETSQSRQNNARNKAQTEWEYIEDMMHELHCLAVEVDIAEREDERYGEKIITSSNGWAELKKLRREPNK